MSTAEAPEVSAEQLNQFRADFAALRDEIGKVIVGQTEIVEGVLIALVAGGHVLVEGVPGLGKTLLVRTLAEVLDLQYQRIQFTPDLMPADVIGTYIVMESHGQRKFEFRHGPVFTNILLADEINRATPKTQSALLEAMQERSVTVAHETYNISAPNIVLATQNPLEMEGTFPLPEAQLDRFMFKLKIGFPSAAEIDAILDRTTESDEPVVSKVCNGDRILEMSELARQIPAASEVRQYAIAILLATHPDQPLATEMTRRYIRYGASPRGTQAMILGAKIIALLDGRFNLSREDIQQVAPAALRHRFILNFDGHAENIDPDAIINDILASVN